MREPAQKRKHVNSQLWRGEAEIRLWRETERKEGERRTSDANPLTPILKISNPILPPSPGCSPTSHITQARASLFCILVSLLASRATRLAAPDGVEVGERMRDLRTRMVAVTDEAGRRMMHQLVREM